MPDDNVIQLEDYFPPARPADAQPKVPASTPPPKASATFKPLRLRDSGPVVCGFQERLALWGLYQPGSDDDGVFGQYTEEATRGLQARLGVAVTGEFDESTTRALKVELAKGSNSKLAPSQLAAVVAPESSPPIAPEVPEVPRGRSGWFWVALGGAALMLLSLFHDREDKLAGANVPSDNFLDQPDEVSGESEPDDDPDSHESNPEK